MDTQDIERDIRNMKQSITTYESNLAVRREGLARAEIQLAKAIAAESKKLELVNGDYGKFSISKWVFVDGKVNWEDSGIDKNHFEGILGDSRRGNIFREMGE